MKISACLITLNEEANIHRCLTSIASIVDEIILVDSGSQDKTVEIAQSFPSVKIIPHDWEGYVKQKNFALAQATHDWVLSIDADEELSPELQQEFLALKKESPETRADGYSVPRIVFYENQWIRFGDWYPDRLVRLFQKEKAQFTGQQVHERLELQGSVASLSGELYHYTYKDLQDQLDRIEKYSQLWAESALERGKQSSLFSPYLRAGWRFLRCYFLKGGWKGGLTGFKISRLVAYEVFLKYQKLRILRGLRRS